MIFMSQSGLVDTARERDWDAWYVEHLRIMLTVPGILSTQRFKCRTAGHPPSLAMYSVATPEVFRDPYYLGVRGMGEWLPLIDRQWYRRNLFDGAECAPAVAEGLELLVIDAHAPAVDAGGVAFTWLEAAGLDASTPHRGIAIVPAASTTALPAGCALYRPVTPCGRKA